MSPESIPSESGHLSGPHFYHFNPLVLCPRNINLPKPSKALDISPITAEYLHHSFSDSQLVHFS